MQGESRPWAAVDVESVTELRSALGTFLITRAEQLAALNAELARSNEELDAFAYVAAHDLKEPLRGISNFTTFLVEDYEDTLDADARERLATILRLSQRMASLLDTLLDYSRIGRAELALTEFTVGEVLEDALDLLAAKPALTVEGSEMALRGDRIRVRQLLVNLIGNAVKYSAEAPEISRGRSRRRGVRDRPRASASRPSTTTPSSTCSGACTRATPTAAAPAPG